MQLSNCEDRKGYPQLRPLGCRMTPIQEHIALKVKIWHIHSDNKVTYLLYLSIDGTKLLAIRRDGPDAAEAFNRHHVPSQSPLLLLLPSCNSTQNCPARLHNTEQKPGSGIRRRRSSRCRQQSHYPKATPMILFTLALPTCQTIRRPLIWSSLMFYRRAP